MRFTIKQLKKMTVETLSGIVLGKVVDVVIDDEGQHIVQYEVKRSLTTVYLISRDQVASFEANKLFVYDTALGKEEKRKIAPTSRRAMDPAAALDTDSA